MNLDIRLRRLERLRRFQQRIIRISGSLEAAKSHPQWDNIELLINTISGRVATSLEPPDISQPLTVGEIALINLLISQLGEL